MIKTSIVIPNINNLELLKNCIESIIANSVKDTYEIIVVDNGSNKETIDYIENEQRIKYVLLHKNMGFATACNSGLSVRAENTNVLILNNDTVFKEDILTTMNKKIEENNKIGIVGCIMLYPDGSIQSSGGFLLNNGFGSHFTDIPQQDREVEYAPGACILVSNALILDLGGRIFDEVFYPAYSEDVYLAFEARNHGYMSIVTPDVSIFHFEGMTQKKDELPQEERIKIQNGILKNREILLERILLQDYTEEKDKKVAFLADPNYIIRSLSKELNKTSVDVAIYSQNKNIVDFELKKMTQKLWEKERINIAYTTGSNMNTLHGNKTIGYTAHDSVSKIPETWVHNLNQLDRVWTTSEFCKKVFINSGVKKQIDVIPYGVDREIFNENIKKAKLSYTKGFIFFCNTPISHKSNLDILLEAYTSSFTYEDNVTLLLNCDILKKEKISQYFIRFQRKDRKTPKVELIESPLGMSQLASIYSLSDCYINIGTDCHGTCLIQSMSCGKPSIVSNWGVHTQYCNSENSILIEQKKEIPFYNAEDYLEYVGGTQYIPSVSDVANAMKKIYRDSELYKRLSKNSLNTSKEFTWEKIAKMCEKSINTL